MPPALGLFGDFRHNGAGAFLFGGEGGMKIQLGEWTLEEHANLLTNGDKTVRLEKRVMAVLMQLIRADGGVVSKDALIDEVWNGAAVSDHSVANAISDLRRALGDDRREPRYIETIPKRGYRLLVPATEALSPPGATKTQIYRDRPWAALLSAIVVVAAVVAGWFFLKPAQPARLFFADIENASGDNRLDIAGDAATEMLTVALAGGDYRLVRWRGPAQDARKDVRLRKQDRILAGRIIDDGGEPTLALNMTDARDGASVWAQAYPLNEENYSALAGAVVADLRAPLDLGEPLSAYAPADPALAEAYWRARHLWSLREPETIREALSILTDITQRAPDFAAAQAAIADIYAHKTAEELGLARQETYALAERHLAEAKALDPDLGEAFVTRAYLSFFRDRNTAAAMRDIANAIAAQPDNAVAWQTKAMIASAAGDAKTSLFAIERARRLDPLSASVLWDKVWFLYVGRRYGDALDAAKDARRVAPPVDVYEALIHLARGDESAAFESWLTRAKQRGLTQARADELRGVAAGDGAKAALGMLADDALAKQDYQEFAIPLASLLTALDRRDDAVGLLLAEPPGEKSWWWSWYDVIPALDAVRGDPRLRAIGAGAAG